MSLTPRNVIPGSLLGPRGKTGAPGPDAIPTQEAVAAYVDDDGSDVATAVDNRVDTKTATMVADKSALPTYVTSRARANPFDPIRGVYNWKPTNTRRLRAGLGKAARGGISEHVVAGDSMAAGCVYGIAGANPLAFDRAGAWPLMMRDRLANLGIPKCGSGWIRVNDNALGSPYGWALTGSPAWSLAGVFYAFNTGGGVATFTVPAELAGATAYSHLWVDTGVGGGAFPFTIKVNGATSGPGYRAVTSVTGQARYRVTTLLLSTPLAAGDTITIQGGANGHYFVAGRVWNPAKGGLSVHNLAQSSSRAYGTTAANNRWATTGNNALGGLLSPTLPNGTTAWTPRTVTDAVLTASSTTITSATAAFTDDDLGKSVSTPAGSSGLRLPASGNVYITAINSATSVEVSQAALLSASTVTLTIGQTPDVLHIGLGANDLNAGISNANIAAAITTIRGYMPTSDVILYSYPQPNPTVLAAATYDGWVASLYDLADTLNVPLVDMRAKFGAYGDWSGHGLAGDGAAHANSYLFAEWGQIVASLLAA